MHAEILSIGTELLMGELVDTNSSYLASELANLGIDVRWVTKVGDDPNRLHEAIERAFRRSDVTLTSGGLGPTSDDLTRETIARVCGEQMTVQDDLLKHLRSLFANRGFPMPETNVKQATLIPSAEAIPNPMGTAPGWWVEREDSVIVAMPGPPREIQQMWANEVAPRLKARNTGIAIATRNLKTFGITEGGLDELLSPLFESENPLLGIYSKQDGIHLRAIATAATDEDASALIAPMEAEIRGIIGDDAIWGEDDETPESKAIGLLRDEGLTLAVMEAFTGGLMSNNLTEIEGSEYVLKGGAIVNRVYSPSSLGVNSDIVEKHGFASGEAAQEMARAARQTFGADVGIGISPLALESADGSVVAGTSFIGYSMVGRSDSTSGHYPTRRLRIRSRAVTHALLGMIRFVRGSALEAVRPRR
jgi:nicotinamide-nucleotide amidase